MECLRPLPLLLLACLVAHGSAAQGLADSVVIGTFFHATAGTFREDIARVSDLEALGLTTWFPEAYDQAELDAWLRAADEAGANVIFKFLGEVSPGEPVPEEDELNLDRFGRVCRLTIEAEDTDAVVRDGGGAEEPVALLDAEGLTGWTAEGDVGTAVRLPVGRPTAVRSNPHRGAFYWSRRCNVGGFRADPSVDSAGVRHRREPLMVRLRIDEVHGPTLASLLASDPDAVVARLMGGYGEHTLVREIRVRDLQVGYAVYEGAVPFYRTGSPRSTLRMELASTGLASLVVDRFRFQNERADRLFHGEFDAEIARQASACWSPRCIRTYVNDEPEYAEWEAWRHIDSVLNASLARRALTSLYWGVDAELVRRWAVYVRPAEILVDPYPIAAGTFPLPDMPRDAPAGHGVPPYQPDEYDRSIRAAFDEYADDLEGVANAARSIDRPMWLVLQAHGIAHVQGNPPLPEGIDALPPSGNGRLVYRFRPPTPSESSAMAFMGLAHGARAFFHFLYKSLDGCGANGCEAYVGLVGPRHERADRAVYAGAAPLYPLWTDYEDRWDATSDLNSRLTAMLRALAGRETTWAGLAADMPADAPIAGFTEAGKPAEDLHIGVFDRLGGSDERPFLVVNRLTGPAATRALALMLPPTGAWSTVIDLETNEPVGTISPDGGTLALSLAPGDGRLLSVRESSDGSRPEPTLGRPQPNPAATAVAARLTLPEASAVRASVHDMLGREVHVVLDAALEAGEHELRWSTSGLAAGVYTFRIGTARRTLSEMFTVAR